MGCAKTAEPIEKAVWGVDPGGPEEPCIRWTPDLTRGRGNFGGAPPAMRLFVRVLWPLVYLDGTRYFEIEMALCHGR